MEDRVIEWSKLFSAREKIHKRYRSIWNVPLIKKRSALLRRILKDDMSLLDIGAFTKGTKAEINKIGIKIDYKSMDLDHNIEHDFYNIEDVKEQFDVVALFEVIEHMPFKEGWELLKRSRDIVKDDGIIVVSTPNVFHPSRFFTTSTHKAFYMYDELAGLIEMAGFEIIDLYRSFNDAFHRYVLKVYVFDFLFRFLSIDYAYSIFVVGRKAP
jgi:SAM-dependent methyltransferase